MKRAYGEHNPVPDRLERDVHQPKVGVHPIVRNNLLLARNGKKEGGGEKRAELSL